MRPLRALFLANDGASVGHVTRALAIARALRREAGACDVAVQPLLATTSSADALLAWAGVPVVRFPHPGAGGLPEAERRALATKVLEGVVAGFAPDVLVTDTFPAGPHLEAWPILDLVPRRVLVRRSVRPDRADGTVARAGLDRYERIVVPDDPADGERAAPPLDPALSARVVRVPPVVLLRDDEILPRAQAVTELCERHGLEGDVLVGVRAEDDRDGVCALESVRAAFAGTRRRIVVADGSVAPIQRLVRAFDVALVAAGYNTAHECAAAGVPAVLFARPREFDDQAARARRFEAAGLGVHLAAWDVDAIRAAVSRAETLPRPALRCDGAEAAARTVLALCGVRSVPGRTA